METFEVANRKFTVRKVDAIKQFHIVRRIGPLLTGMLSKSQKLQKVGSMKKFEALPEDEKFAIVADLVVPIMNGLSQMSDEDSECVLFGLLSAAEVQQAAGNWAPVVSGSTLMFQDMDLPVLVQVAARAFMHNLSGFFAALPQ